MKKSLILFTIFTGALFMSGNAIAQTSEYANPDRWIRNGTNNGVQNRYGVDIILIAPTGDCAAGASNASWADARRSSSDWGNGVEQSLGLNSFVNVYHPVYRYGCFGGGGMDMNGQGMRDLNEAIDYYWQNLNKGERPFFMLGFSQGAYVMWNVILGRLESNAEMQKFHIFSYSLGPPHSRGANVTNGTARRIAWMSQTPTDINKVGCFAAYSEGDPSSSFPYASPAGEPTTNPISWTTDHEYHACSNCGNNILGARVAFVPGSTNRSALFVRPNPSRPPSYNNDGWGHHGSESWWFGNRISANMRQRIEAWNQGSTTVCENPAPTPTQGNLVRDGIFPGASLGSNWSLTNTGDNVVATASVRCNDANISITSVGAQIFQPQLIQSGIRLERGRAYRLTFRASAAANRTIVAQLERMGGNGVEWGHTYGRQTFNLTQAGATHTLEFNMTDPTDENAQLAFNFGGSGSTHNVTISDVVLVSTGTVSVNSIQPALAKQPLTTLRDRTLFVNASPETNVQVRIVNLSGKTVATINTHGGTTHSLSSIPAGTFIVEARRSGYNDVVTRRMTVQK